MLHHDDKQHHDQHDDNQSMRSIVQVAMEPSHRLVHHQQSMPEQLPMRGPIALWFRRVRGSLDALRREYDHDYHDQQHHHDDNDRAADNHHDDDQHHNHNDQQHDHDNHHHDCRRVLSVEWRAVLPGHRGVLYGQPDPGRVAWLWHVLRTHGPMRGNNNNDQLNNNKHDDIML